MNCLPAGTLWKTTGPVPFQSYKVCCLLQQGYFWDKGCWYSAWPYNVLCKEDITIWKRKTAVPWVHATTSSFKYFSRAVYSKVSVFIQTSHCNLRLDSGNHRIKACVSNQSSWVGQCALIAMKWIVRNKNEGPKTHKNWQVTIIMSLPTVCCKPFSTAGAQVISVYLEKISPQGSWHCRPVCTHFWNGRRDSVSVCLITPSYSERSASQHQDVREAKCTKALWNLFSPWSFELLKLPRSTFGIYNYEFLITAIYTQKDWK